jgi:hypothetical protein
MMNMMMTMMTTTTTTSGGKNAEFGMQVTDKHISASCTKGLKTENNKRSECANFGDYIGQN